MLERGVLITGQGIRVAGGHGPESERLAGAKESEQGAEGPSSHSLGRGWATVRDL